MYDNIGEKIKVLAKVVFIVGAIAAVIAGIALMRSNVPIGLLVIVLGSIIALISSWLIYGFGELIDKTCDIARNTHGGERKSEAQSKVDYERVVQIEKLRSKGLITEEEYQKAISKNDKE